MFNLCCPMKEISLTVVNFEEIEKLPSHITRASQTFYNILLTWIPDIGLGVRVFANGPGDLGSIPGRVIPKTQKMVLDASLLNTQHYKVRIKGKVGQSMERVAPSPTHWCSSYRKGSLRVTLDYGRQLYLLINLGNSRCFCQGYEGSKPYWSVKCWVCLILSECYLPEVPLWLGGWPQNLQYF